MTEQEARKVEMDSFRRLIGSNYEDEKNKRKKVSVLLRDIADLKDMNKALWEDWRDLSRKEDEVNDEAREAGENQ